jgi:hypothetical protein
MSTSDSTAAAVGMPHADTVLFRRRTSELFEGFWRKALQDSSWEARGIY